MKLWHREVVAPTFDFSAMTPELILFNHYTIVLTLICYMMKLVEEVD